MHSSVALTTRQTWRLHIASTFPPWGRRHTTGSKRISSSWTILRLNREREDQNISNKWLSNVGSMPIQTELLCCWIPSTFTWGLFMLRWLQLPTIHDGVHSKDFVSTPET